MFVSEFRVTTSVCISLARSASKSVYKHKHFCALTGALVAAYLPWRESVRNSGVYFKTDPTPSFTDRWLSAVRFRLYLFLLRLFREVYHAFLHLSRVMSRFTGLLSLRP